MSADQISDDEARGAQEGGEEKPEETPGQAAILKRRPRLGGGGGLPQGVLPRPGGGLGVARTPGKADSSSSGLIERKGPSTMVLSAINMKIPEMLLDPPEAPDGVETPAQSEEVTQMTERTAQLLGLMRESEQEDEDRPVGRGGLPEELFLTDEMANPNFKKGDEAIDELGWDDKDKPEEVTQQANMALARKLAGDRQRAAAVGIDSGEWGDLIDEVGFDGAFEDNAPEPIAPVDRPSGDLPSLSEEEADAAFATLFGDEEPEPSEPDEPGSDEVADGEHLLIVEEDPGEVFGDLTSSLDEEVLDGYRLPFPFKIGPDARDLSMGIQHATVDQATKDRCFPKPEPKTPGIITKREFVLEARVGPPPMTSGAAVGAGKDRSRFIIAAVVLLIVGIIITLILLNQ